MTNLQVFKLSLSHALVLRPDDVGKLTFYAIYLFLTKVSRQTQDHKQLLRLVALKGAIYSTNMGCIKRHSHGCKSKDQVELTLKNSKPQISPWMRGKNQSFEGLLWGHGPKSYNWILGFSRERGALVESMRSSNPRRNISSD